MDKHDTIDALSNVWWDDIMKEMARNMALRLDVQIRKSLVRPITNLPSFHDHAQTK